MANMSAGSELQKLAKYRDEPLETRIAILRALSLDKFEDMVESDPEYGRNEKLVKAQMGYLNIAPEDLEGEWASASAAERVDETAARVVASRRAEGNGDL